MPTASASLFQRQRWGAIVLAGFLAAALLAAPRPGRAEERKFALAMFHFNVQYVAGGLRGFLPLGLDGFFTDWEMSAEEVEDMIIVESFEPVLDLYLRHPGWGVDLELQSYFLEVMAERHPLVLTKLRTLAERGQADIVSFHYSDQLFIGYPRAAWETSMLRTEDVFEDLDLDRSNTVFCQEGQGAVGMAAAMAEYGYDLMVWPKNLWIYQHGDFDAHPYYTFGDVELIVGAKGVDYTDGDDTLQMTWTFLDDGEKLATCDFDPYFPPVFKENAACLNEYETRLEDLEADGWDIATSAEYLAGAKGMGIEPETLPPLLDGTWQPDSTNGPFRWLGGAGLWRTDERDNDVRTLCEIAYREAMAAEVAVAESGIEGADALSETWRILNLGMVTDGTGINPYKGEIGYAISHCGEAARRARALIEEAKDSSGITTARIDTAAGTFELDAEPPDDPAEALEVAPYDVTVEAARRAFETQWFQTQTSPPVYRLDVLFDDDAGREVSVTFAGDADDLIFSSALADDVPLIYSRDDFVFVEWPMPLPNGWLNLGGDWWVVKDMAYTHIAAFVRTDSGEVRFEDDTVTPKTPVQWRFYLVNGSMDEALDFANGLNVTPTLIR